MPRGSFDTLRNAAWHHPAHALAVLASAQNADGTPFTLPTGTTQAERVAAGMAYVAGSGRLTLAAAGNVRWLITNPVASGRNLYVPVISFFGTATGFAQMYVDPTTGVPATANRPVLNALAGGGVASVGTLKVDTNAVTPLGGGTDTGIVIGFGPNARVEVEMAPEVLVPGRSLGINVAFAGASDLTMNVVWWEG